jgi:hypothetical protein
MKKGAFAAVAATIVAISPARADQLAPSRKELSRGSAAGAAIYACRRATVTKFLTAAER